MIHNNQFKELMAQFWGWILFLICAVLFTVSSVKSGDGLLIVASIFFVLGCVVFMVPLIRAILNIRKIG